MNEKRSERLSSMKSFTEEASEVEMDDANWAAVISSDDGIASIDKITQDGIPKNYNDLSAEERFQVYSAVRQAGERLWILLVRDASTVAFYSEEK